MPFDGTNNILSFMGAISCEINVLVSGLPRDPQKKAYTSRALKKAYELSIVGTSWVFLRLVLHTLLAWQGAAVGKNRKKIWMTAPFCACFGLVGALEIDWCSRMGSPPSKGLKLTLYPICGLGLNCIV